jgi:preprotein translocase subunit SecF
MRRTWKADEMEMALNFKAMRLSWVFVLAALIVWCIVALAIYGEKPFIPFIIICIQSTIFFATKLVLSRKMTKERMDDNEE